MDLYEDDTESDIVEQDLFKPEYKKYKRKDRQLELNDVIDFTYETNLDKVEEISLQESQHPAVRGLKPVKEWKSYAIKGFPGFIFIQNPFEDGNQRYWIERCVLDYPNKPSKTILDNLVDMSNIDDIWFFSQNQSDKNITGKDSLIMKLRWATMGYNYEWNSRAYYDEMKSSFPCDLHELCRYIASTIGYHHFSAETAIVNYYHMSGDMGPHKDISEIDHDAPLLSFSFGQDALFLLGGLTKATKPVCLSLHSGDVCIMYGDCRLVYHAVPRILPASLESLKHRFNFSSTSDICENKSPKEIDISSQEVCEVKATSRQGVNWELFDQYLQCTRINMNVRQVLPPGGMNIADFPPPVCPSMNCSKEGKK
ncbi:nucleic acid dioxygenase ALKBH1-like [Ostrea edulis]|uniref:nucleic acid dioxygenase ALKBH1-like n=1 Tax=Ostrea edulis TaxID=37623 RepID=UPI0024AF9ED9|nr:nucleic acid dioxygenase ALKBH1-like [Ostrea edulis]